MTPQRDDLHRIHRLVAGHKARMWCAEHGRGVLFRRFVQPDDREFGGMKDLVGSQAMLCRNYFVNRATFLAQALENMGCTEQELARELDLIDTYDTETEAVVCIEYEPGAPMVLELIPIDSPCQTLH